MARPPRAPRRRRWLGAIALTGALCAIAAASACSGDGGRSLAKPSRRATSGVGGAGGGELLFDAGSTGPPSPDSGADCGNQVHGIAIRDAPNVLFVLDVSGSMTTPDGPGGQTRYRAVRDAATDLVRSLGTLVNVGVAVFPLGGDCNTGALVLPPTPGSPPNADGSDGETTSAFLDATNVSPVGGTPTAATLKALAPQIAGWKGQTIVLLATDGGPNCNDDATCGKDTCIANLEGQCVPADANCCAPGGDTGPRNCLDTAPTVAAVDALHQAGVTVYVIGIATTAVYQGVLDAMASKGGAPLAGPHAYYQVDDLGAELVATLGAIAGQFISCEFTLEKPPDDPSKTNVWLDQTMLPFDPVNGWYWKVEHSEIALAGDACKAVKTGQVHQVQIVEGCPTQVSK